MLSNLSKVFAGILNCKIVLWSEAKDIIAEYQAEFREEQSTIDQIFILKTIVDKFLDKRTLIAYYSPNKGWFE